MSYHVPKRPKVKYKGVPIPPFEMVGDILTVTSVEKPLKTNHLVNTFIESKRLRLSDKNVLKFILERDMTAVPLFRFIMKT